VADEPKKPNIPISTGPNHPAENPVPFSWPWLKNEPTDAVRVSGESPIPSRTSGISRAPSPPPSISESSGYQKALDTLGASAAAGMAAKLRADQEKAMGETTRQTIERVAAESAPIADLSETVKPASPHSLRGDTVVSDHSNSTGTPFTVFDYLGLGFILEPPAVMVHAVMTGEPLKWSNAWYAIPFVALGAAFIYIGRNWATLKERANQRVVDAVDGLSRSYFVPFIIVLLALVGIAVLPFWIWPPANSGSSTGPTANEIAAAVVKALPKPTWDAGVGSAGIGQMPIGGPPSESLLEQPVLIWDGKDGPITFRARIDHSGEKLPVYLDWGQAGFFGQQIFNNGFYSGPRVEIGFVERFVVGQSLSVTIGMVSTDPSGQQMLQWGEPHYNNAKVGISQGGYVARVVIIGKDGKEERYPFLIIPAPHAPGSPSPWAPPTLVGTGVLQGAIQ
jgi:hypothetical protein